MDGKQINQEGDEWEEGMNHSTIENRDQTYNLTGTFTEWAQRTSIVRDRFCLILQNRAKVFLIIKNTWEHTDCSAYN